MIVVQARNPQPVARSARPMPGVGTRLTYSEIVGYSVSAAGTGASYPHPFKPALGNNQISLSRGLIDAFEPVIHGKPISSGARLELDPNVANANGESWVCVEVVPNADGILDKDSRVEIVHTATVRSLDPQLGRAALVQVLWKAGRAWLTQEIVLFNLQYERVLPAPGHGVVRHLFR